ncbi:MAG: hypothetical protein WCZ21_01565 [Bacteroidales bacterium]|jgi:hypothetical protein
MEKVIKILKVISLINLLIITSLLLNSCKKNEIVSEKAGKVFQKSEALPPCEWINIDYYEERMTPFSECYHVKGEACVDFINHNVVWYSQLTYTPINCMDRFIIATEVTHIYDISAPDPYECLQDPYNPNNYQVVVIQGEEMDPELFAFRIHHLVDYVISFYGL